jgi:uncharacterized protein YbjQ (UPF0145 family)
MKYLFASKAIRRGLLAGAAAIALHGCATWSEAEHKPVGQAASQEIASETKVDEKKLAAIIVTEGDITDRKYKNLGEISATVNKSTIFHPDPTRELVAEKLRESAAQIGADAVIQVRYGNVGVTMLSWGSISGKGRAVAFTD